MYDVCLRLIGKRVVDFLFVITEHFLLGVMAEVPRANIYWKWAFSQERGRFRPKFQVQGVASTNHCSCQKTRM